MQNLKLKYTLKVEGISYKLEAVNSLMYILTKTYESGFQDVEYIEINEVEYLLMVLGDQDDNIFLNHVHETVQQIDGTTDPEALGTDKSSRRCLELLKKQFITDEELKEIDKSGAVRLIQYEGEYEENGPKGFKRYTAFSIYIDETTWAAVYINN